MNPQKWQKIKEIFNQAVDLPVAERPAFLDDSCAGGEEMRHELEKMLAFAEDDTLEENVFSYLTEEKVNPLPEKIGAYKILREIGRGGMGVVYEALRETADFKQKVALKVIKRGMDTDAILSRFRHEQQILASLEHPSIARFLDGGMTNDGLAFYAMEYVEGEFVDDYCRQKSLSLNERLALFRQICSAVQYAHQNLVIHRDLKPSNILVTRDGAPKLLDFGIGKILETDGTVGTATALGMMTPAYASPEQIRGERVNTATDVYSLGVILFELLTGQRPYKINIASQYEIQKIICESAPLRPSSAIDHQRLTGSDQSSGATAQNKERTTNDKEPKNNPKSPIQNGKSLRGDIDNILLKALRKNPAQRYASVGAFSEDIRLYLEGLPITARPDSFTYRAAKFVRRNRIPVIASAVVLLSLFIGIGVALRQTYRAEQQRILAERRFAEVRRIANDFVFKYTEAISNLPNSSPVRAMLLQDASAYLDDLARDSEGDYALQRELATAYQKLGDIQGKPHSASIGDTKGAIKSYDRAIELLGNVYRDAASEDKKIESATQLINTYRIVITTLARSADDSEKRSEYVKKRRALVEELNKNFPENFQFKIEAARMEISKASLLMQSDFAPGERYFEEKILPFVAEIERAHLDDPAAEKLAARVYNELGWRYSEYGKFMLELDGDRAKAVPLFEKGLDSARREMVLDERYYKRAPRGIEEKRVLGVCYTNYGIALRNLQKFDEALEYLTKGYEIKRELAEFDRSNLQAIFDMGTIFSELGLWHYEKGNQRAAIPEFEKSRAHFDRVIAADEQHHEAVYYRNDVLIQLAYAYAKSGNYAKSLEIVREAENFSRAKKADDVDSQIQSARIFLHRGNILNDYAKENNATDLKQKACGEFEAALEKMKKIESGEKDVQLRIIENRLAKCGKTAV